MRGIKNATVQNAEVDVVAESAGVTRDLERARRLLGELIEAGQGGRVNGKGNERLMLEQNLRKMQSIEADLATVREQLPKHAVATARATWQPVSLKCGLSWSSV
jgi:hypothetical protein